MAPRRFGYQAEKLSNARRMLMLPHPEGETGSIRNALLACYYAFRDLDVTSLDDHARSCFEAIQKASDRINLEEFSIEEKTSFSKAVDELAHWFEWRYLLGE